MIRHLSYNHLTNIETREQLIRGQANSYSNNKVVLATCNRYEIYWGEGKVQPSTLRHLFRVTSGLESCLLGETSIQNQVKQSYLTAKENVTMHKGMHKLFQTALHVGKSVRQHTGISKGAVSHSQAVIKILEDQKFDFRNKTVAIIGVNKINNSIVKFLTSKGCKTILMGNRNFDKIKALENQYCKAFRLESLTEMLRLSDVAISATSAPHYIIGPQHLPHNKKLQIFDLAVPRDVNPLVLAFDNISLNTVQDVEAQINQNLQLRSEKILLAEEIIENEVQRFVKLQNPKL